MVLLLGDSFGNSAYQGFRALAEEQGWGLGAFLRPGCPWMLDLYSRVGDSALCLAAKPVLDDVLASVDPDVVVIHGFPYAMSSNVRFVDDGGEASSGDVVAAARTTIADIEERGAEVVFLDSTPFAPDEFNVSNCLKTQRWADDCDFEFKFPDDPLRTALRADAETDPRLDFVSINDYICDDDECISAIGDVGVMADSTHVSGGLFVLLRHELLEQITVIPG